IIDINIITVYNIYCHNAEMAELADAYV
ncbi:MAG: hypothetical protein PWQ60_1835, partial [Thermoanaerobacteraceae bacterium]|nr:hypothetical protein [Thermoanaerobacteraceae bacterium]